MYTTIDIGTIIANVLRILSAFCSPLTAESITDTTAQSSTRYIPVITDDDCPTLASEISDIRPIIDMPSPRTRGANSVAVADMVSVIPFMSVRMVLRTASCSSSCFASESASCPAPYRSSVYAERIAEYDPASSPEIGAKTVCIACPQSPRQSSSSVLNLDASTSP